MLDERATHYLINVLRCREGEHLLLFNGDGSDYPACISAIKKRHIEVTLSEGIPIANESPIESYLGIALSKGDRFDWVLQKATELGVTHIFPLLTERVNVKLVILIGSGLSIGGVVLSSFTTTFWPFVMFYCVMNGLGCGM